MATLVGTQTNFADALRELVELDYDAIEAYAAAIDRLGNTKYKNKLEQFKADHENHVVTLNKFLRDHEEEGVEGPDAKKWLAKGKVILATLIDDKSILQAMLSNEEDTNNAYERMNAHEDIWPEVAEALSKGLADEKAHMEWFEETIEEIEEAE